MHRLQGFHGLRARVIVHPDPAWAGPPEGDRWAAGRSMHPTLEVQSGSVGTSEVGARLGRNRVSPGSLPAETMRRGFEPSVGAEVLECLISSGMAGPTVRPGSPAGSPRGLPGARGSLPGS